MAALDTLLAALDPDPGVRGKQWERICAWYLTHDPGYKEMLRRVWLWDDWPEDLGPDTGIDLVAEGYDGRLWAIQAKAYSQRYSVTKSDMDTFLSASNRSEFDFRLLIATTDRLAPHARKTAEAQQKPVHLRLLGDL